MYELKQGTQRLTTALYSIKDEDRSIERLAVLLNYIPSQLREDIQALNDFVSNKGDLNDGKENI